VAREVRERRPRAKKRGTMKGKRGGRESGACVEKNDLLLSIRGRSGVSLEKEGSG